MGDSTPILQALTGRNEWPIGALRLCAFADIDEGLAGRVTESLAQIMPHGGLRVMRRLTDWLMSRGVRPADDLGTSSAAQVHTLYPEATDVFEALVLLAVTQTASSLAIDLLLDQPRRWQRLANVSNLTPADHERSLRLNRLLRPPIVVLAGPPNVGKSTLTNALLGRTQSIVMDEPGTTRDYTTGLIDLGGLVVHWHDTPGIRTTANPIEARAIEISRRLIDHADLLIAMTDFDHDWPDLPQVPHLRVGSKADLRARSDVDVSISATTGQGLAALVGRIRESLVPSADLDHRGAWVFDPRLLDVLKQA